MCYKLDAGTSIKEKVMSLRSGTDSYFLYRDLTLKVNSLQMSILCINDHIPTDLATAKLVDSTI